MSTTSPVTLYSKPGCQPCRAVKKLLYRLGVPHEIVDVTTDSSALEYVQSQGYDSVPLLRVPNPARDLHISGFAADAIRQACTPAPVGA
ncbi:gp53, glutaredoxin [Corynebacterium phage BFK20]|uniref:Gp53, glutaredoxin n=1 Tax=Corynebacterium phage BFK20 TaxID=28358 RepID=Q3V5E2_9CAUD|nr:thioredoxin domain [Corynebacterium phage BFK20]CAJ29736.1 gp53, glutaredoxin [Corynebacterium phage BFK20]